jgi:hypothetical protein
VPLSDTVAMERCMAATVGSLGVRHNAVEPCGER